MLIGLFLASYVSAATKCEKLMYSGDSKKNKLYKLRGKHVRVRGKLYGGMTAYYVVPVYIDLKTIEKIK